MSAPATPPIPAASPPPAASPGAFVLKSSQFRADREAAWRELEHLLDVVESSGIGALDAHALARLPALYRSTVGALSVARAISLDRNLLDYLTHLSMRAHLVVYSGRQRPVAAMIEFFRARFPGQVRAFRAVVTVAAASLLLGIACGYLMTRHDMERYHSFVAPALAQGRTPDAPTDSLRAPLYRTMAEDQLNFFASYLFQHNAGVGILCLALGFAAGVPVLFVLFSNGLIFGAMVALYASRGLAGEFLAWALPHGVTELLAVILCGAAGLVFGGTIVFPAAESRRDALARRGRAAGLVVVGAVGMFLIAAVMEGFFRQLVHSPAIRLAVAGTSAVAWALYFVLAGRKPRHG